MTDAPAAGDEPTPEPDGLGALLREGVAQAGARAAARPPRRAGCSSRIVVIGWAATSIYRVQPDEQGVVLRFGAGSTPPSPGLHVHCPSRSRRSCCRRSRKINQVQLGNAAARPATRRADASGRC